MKFYYLPLLFAAALAVAGCTDKGDEPVENETEDDVEITLSQDEVYFEKDGGSVSITVTSNIPLSLEATNYPDDDDNTDSSTSDGFEGNFFEPTQPMDCKTSFSGNILTIETGKSMNRHDQTINVRLYDGMGQVQASVKVTQAGDSSIADDRLSQMGRKMISESFEAFAKALSWINYVERGYTGMSQFYDVRCPLDAYSSHDKMAFEAAYKAVAYNARIIRELEGYGVHEAKPFLTLLNAIVYTEMVDKWGNIGLAETVTGIHEWPSQDDASYILHYLLEELDKIESVFSEKAGVGGTEPDDLFNMPKDVWRMAKANVHIALGQFSSATPLLREIFHGSRYSLSADKEHTPNPGSILYFAVPEEVASGQAMSYFSYADVLLLLAEYHAAAGDDDVAEEMIRDVAEAKRLSISGDNMADIEKLRKALFMPRYFAFQKRNGLGGYADYQRLWPIPASQLAYMANWSQNSGY